jgi:hypothetical protein
MSGLYDDHGIRFQYPSTWELDESEDDTDRVCITVQSTSGPAFAMVTLDENRPDPREMADEALRAMREEYAEAEITSVFGMVAKHDAIGHDLEFFELDLLNGCAIRAFRTPRRTVLIFTQWSMVDLDDDEPEAIVQALLASFAETDA